MIDIKFKECCNTCDNLKVRVDDNTIFVGFIKAIGSIVIGCEHEKVCGAYLNDVSAKVVEVPKEKHEPITLNIGGVYEIHRIDFVQLDTMNPSKRTYARAILIDYGTVIGMAKLITCITDSEVNVPIDYLVEVSE